MLIIKLKTGVKSICSWWELTVLFAAKLICLNWVDFLRFSVFLHVEPCLEIKYFEEHINAPVGKSQKEQKLFNQYDQRGTGKQSFTEVRGGPGRPSNIRASILAAGIIRNFWSELYTSLACLYPPVSPWLNFIRFQIFSAAGQFRSLECHLLRNGVERDAGSSCPLTKPKFALAKRRKLSRTSILSLY